MDITTLLPLDQSDDLYYEIIKDNLNRRVLVFNEDITSDVIENYILRILKWNYEDIDIPSDKREPIIIYFNCPGGEVITGLSMIDVIENSITPIRGVCLGTAASMGFAVFIACHERIAFPNSVLLMHDGNIGIQNSNSKAKDTMLFIDSLDDRIKKHVLKHTIMTEEFYEQHYDQEYYMFADKEGRALGCVDKIIGEDVDIDRIY